MASLPYPRSQPNHLPTEATEPTEVSGARYSPTDCGFAQIRRVWHPCHTHATTKLSSHRSHRNHRSFWRKIFSHRLHRLGGYGIPAIPTQPTKLSSHRTLRSLTICEHLCASVGGSSPPEASVCSVISVGGLQCWCTSARLVQQRLLHPLIEHLYSVNSMGEPYAT